MIWPILLQAALPAFVAVPRCEVSATTAEVVVCGKRESAHRLPLPDERAAQAGEAGPIAGTGRAALTPAGRCGVFAGERRCGKREAAAYGYGRGRDPVSVLVKLARAASGEEPD